MTTEFLHHLRDTFILLGGGTRLANMVERAESATQQEVDDLRKTNMRLIDAAKDKLVNLNSIAVTTGAGKGSS